MATPSRSEDLAVSPELEPLLEMLQNEPTRIQFFQAVRLLERVSPGRQPIGRWNLPSREVVRFRAHNAMAFPASQIQEIEWVPDGPPRMSVNFMGLTGHLGVLPLVYSQLVIDRVRAKDTSLRDFFDLFNHRAISLFYQAWEKYRFTVAYERGERDRFSHHLLDLIGLGTPHLQDRQPVQDDSLLYYCGLLALHTRSQIGLEQILEDYFEVPVRVDQYVGAWYRLETDTQCALSDPGSVSEQLGMGAVVGDEIWDQNSGIRVVLGPLNLEQYVMFLPNGSAYPALRSLVKFYAGRELDCELQLILQREEVPACELGSEAEVEPQLGWTSWAKTVPKKFDADDTILRI